MTTEFPPLFFTKLLCEEFIQAFFSFRSLAFRIIPIARIRFSKALEQLEIHGNPIKSYKIQVASCIFLAISGIPGCDKSGCLVHQTARA